MVLWNPNPKAPESLRLSVLVLYHRLFRNASKLSVIRMRHAAGRGCDPAVVVALLPVPSPWGGVSPSHHHREWVCLAVPRTQVLSTSKTRVLFFCGSKCTSRKPSFMAIIAQFVTLWRPQTCVIHIFPSSHLARCLENASI